MTRRLRFHPEARAELRNAVQWYRERSAPYAVQLAHIIDIATTTLRRFPYAWPFVPGWPDVRRYVLSRFPYSILYRASATQLEIIAISHQRRSPDYWAERAKESRSSTASKQRRAPP